MPVSMNEVRLDVLHIFEVRYLCTAFLRPFIRRSMRIFMLKGLLAFYLYHLKASLVKIDIRKADCREIKRVLRVFKLCSFEILPNPLTSIEPKTIPE